MIEYKFASPAIEGFVRLFETTGWNQEYQLKAEDFSRVLERSWLCVSVYDGDLLVGCGRVVTDSVHAMIYDLIVDPLYQNKGIGGKILNLLINRCLEEDVRDIQLFCAKGKIDFYLKRGFQPRPTDAPGMQYRPAL